MTFTRAWGVTIAKYDDIGRTYSLQRRADPRLAALIDAALGDATTVVNVGAGTGSYEPTARRVVAVDPSSVMLAQRAADAAPAVRARAESLPFRTGAFDASLAVLTVHHWVDQQRGLGELARVASRRVVILTWDPRSAGFWLIDDYFPEMLTIERRRFPPVNDLTAILGAVEILPVPIPADCVDGFLGAYWQRPRAYLDPVIRRGMSSFADAAHLGETARRFDRLRDDLESGEWMRRHGDLLERTELDIGYRLIVAAR